MKPESILKIEQALEFVFGENNSHSYKLNENNELIHLSITNFQVKDISFLEGLNSLLDLELSMNQITDVLPLKELENLTTLRIWSNQIADISSLKGLKKLKRLDLWSNKITDVSYLKDLTELIWLDIGSNKIDDISFVQNTTEILTLQMDNCMISDISYLKHLTKLEHLSINSSNAVDFSVLSNLKQLISLRVRNNNLLNIDFLKGFKKISVLDMAGNKISNIRPISAFSNLRELNLAGNPIENYGYLKNLNELVVLTIQDITIKDFTFLPINLLNLTLSYCQLKDISFLSNLAKLRNINLSHNLITNLSVFYSLDELQTINLSNNKIYDLSEFKFIEKRKLYIDAKNNSYFEEHNIILDDNQYETILNELTKLKETRRSYVLPAKVLLLGNTKSGKSTLLDYLLQPPKLKIIKEIDDSTHVLKIEKSPKRLNKDSLPNAVFYDFGGQDYYHGLYNAFMSKNSINIVLWNSFTNYNEIQKSLDRNEETTRNFDKNYWLNQLKYFYTKEEENENDFKIVNEVLFLVQTYADINKRKNYQGECDDFNLLNEFYISLKQTAIEQKTSLKACLDYFQISLNEKINEKRSTVEKPNWYGDFMRYILKKKGEHYTSLKEIESEYKREDIHNIKFLPTDLEQISYSGLILYFKNDPELNDVAWLDPSATLKYIYSKILSKDIIKKKKGIVPADEFSKQVKDDKLIKMLSNQKVIFHDDYENNYIIPGYLPLTTSEDKLYELLTFDFIEPSFVLKFEFFIPFGLINQLICKYGADNSKKYYWRDQLLFTRDNKHKVLIKLDFTNLEISVSVKSSESNKNIDVLKQELFSDILNLYWNEKTLAEKLEDIQEVRKEDADLLENNSDNLLNDKVKEQILSPYNYKSPDDMYLSIDNKTFIHHKTLENLEQNVNKIIAYFTKEENNSVDGENRTIKHIDKSKAIEQASGLYKLYTTNKNVEPVKKIFISYAKENKKEVNEFLRQIAPFKINREVETWHCSELELGEDWENKIMSKFYEADIILYFVSTHFFSTPFILDIEVAKGFERANNPNDAVILVPIILEEIHWDDLLGKYASNYKGIPINLYDKTNNAWYQVVDDLKKHFRTSNPNSIASLLGQSKAKMDAQENIIKEIK